jgi:diguanylate cyclase (GGDEF)-like protein
MRQFPLILRLRARYGRAVVTRRKPPRNRKSDREVAALRREVASLRAAIDLLHRIANLVGTALEVEATCYAILTGVTAGVGLGLNRAMLFLVDGGGRHVLTGAGAIGPDDEAEADRIWRSIAAEGRDLTELYRAGRGAASGADAGAIAGARSALDTRVRATTIEVSGDTPVALALRRGEPVIGGGSDDAGGLFHLPTSIAVPLRDRHAVSGVLYADNRFTKRALDDAAKLVFTLVGEDAGRAIESAQRYERLASEARTDALTGLGHHGALVADTAREVASAIAAKRPLGLLMIDLDGFKRINDQCGHPAGDALLVEVALRMREVIRGGEGVYRYGGDEFAVLLPGATRSAAALIAGRLLRAVAGRPFALGEGRTERITCSIGAASMPEDAEGDVSLVAAADAALLRAKGRGKNVVELA